VYSPGLYLVLVIANNDCNIYITRPRKELLCVVNMTAYSTSSHNFVFYSSLLCSASTNPKSWLLIMDTTINIPLNNMARRTGYVWRVRQIGFQYTQWNYVWLNSMHGSNFRGRSLRRLTHLSISLPIMYKQPEAILTIDANDCPSNPCDLCEVLQNVLQYTDCNILGVYTRELEKFE
jgi:hypothetical protein